MRDMTSTGKSAYKVKYVSDARLEKVVPAGARVEVAWKVVSRGREGIPAGTVFGMMGRGKKGWVGDEDGQLVDWKYVIQEGLRYGEVLDIPLTLTSPHVSGKHKFFWALRDPAGMKIGKRVSCTILVHNEGEEGVVKERGKRVREKRERPPKEPFVWPPNTTHVYLDGNNMLYVPSLLRGLMIGRGGKSRAESVLSAYAHAFAAAVCAEGVISHVTLVFDHSSLSEFQEEVRVGGGDGADGSVERVVHFELKCAHRAGFPIADDALVQWIADLKQQSPEASVVCVTADRGLIERLRGSAAHTVKPGGWFKHTRELINKTAAQDVEHTEVDAVSFDAFFYAWVDAHVYGASAAEGQHAHKRVRMH